MAALTTWNLPITFDNRLYFFDGTFITIATPTLRSASAGFGGNQWGAFGGAAAQPAAPPSVLSALTQGVVSTGGQVQSQFVGPGHQVGLNLQARLLARMGGGHIPGVRPWLTADATFITTDWSDITVDL